MLESDAFDEGIVDVFWKHRSHPPIKRSVQHFKSPTGGAITEEAINILFRRMMHGLVKKLHVLHQDLMHKHQVAQAH